jgi:Mg-chelatase subunit ChlD
VWTYKEWIAGGIVLALATYKIYQYWINRPEYPLVTTRSTQNILEIQIGNPLQNPPPPKITLVFCIDVSGSMNTSERIGAVKIALKAVLEDAQRAVSSGAEIRWEVITFDDRAEIIPSSTGASFTDLKKGEVKIWADLQKQASNLTPGNGGTEILAGLEVAATELIKNNRGTPTIVLLSDGDSNMDLKQLDSIHKRLARVQAKLFAIGIGQSHNKTTLERIVNGKGFEGRYVSTSTGEELKQAIIRIYNQAISPFSDLTLSTNQLPLGSWDVRGRTIVTLDQKESCKLGSLPNGKTLKSFIRVLGNKLSSDFDLSTVVFNLTFTDPNGRTGTIQLYWNADTVIRPDILMATLKEREQTT